MSLIKHTGGRSWNIPAPELLVSADLDLYVQEAFPMRPQSAKAETVTEGVPCLVWDHEAEKLEKLAKGLEQGSYIESADIWCQHFRTSEESALKPTTAPPIKWLKNKKSIQIVLTRNGVTIKKEEWKSHFGTSKTSGFQSGEKYKIKYGLNYGLNYDKKKTTFSDKNTYVEMYDVIQDN